MVPSVANSKTEPTLKHMVAVSAAFDMPTGSKRSTEVTCGLTLILTASSPTTVATAADAGAGAKQMIS